MLNFCDMQASWGSVLNTLMMDNNVNEWIWGAGWLTGWLLSLAVEQFGGLLCSRRLSNSDDGTLRLPVGQSKEWLGEIIAVNTNGH